MNKEEIRKWIDAHRTKWKKNNPTEYQWLIDHLDDPVVLSSVNADITSGLDDIQQVNTNANYNSQQAAKKKQQTSALDEQTKKYAAEAQKQTEAQWGGKLKFVPYEGTMSSEHAASLPNGSVYVPQGLDTKDLERSLARLSPSKRAEIQRRLVDRFQRAASSGSPINGQTVDTWISEANKAADAEPATKTTDGTTPVTADEPAALADPNKPAAGAPDLAQLSGKAEASQDEKDYYKAVTGQDFDQAYNAFANSMAISIQSMDAAGNLRAGTEQLWTSGEFKAPDAGYGFGATKPLGEIKGGDASKYKPTQGQFMGMQLATTLKSTAAIESALAQTWRLAHGTELPNALRIKIAQYVQGMPLDTFAQISKAQGGLQGLLAPDGELQHIVHQYENDPANKVAPPIDTQADADNAPSPIPGVPMNIYKKAQSTMTPLWTDNFHRNPTHEEFVKFGGWNPEDIQRWVSDQPSTDNPGMTVGQRTSYLNMADKMSQKLFGAPADSRMVNALHDTFGEHPKGPPGLPK